MARDILETEMYSGTAYDKTEKLSRTEVVEKMMEAGETVFTVNFNKNLQLMLHWVMRNQMNML